MTAKQATQKQNHYFDCQAANCRAALVFEFTNNFVHFKLVGSLGLSDELNFSRNRSPPNQHTAIE